MKFTRIGKFVTGIIRNIKALRKSRYYKTVSISLDRTSHNETNKRKIKNDRGFPKIIMSVN